MFLNCSKELDLRESFPNKRLWSEIRMNATIEGCRESIICIQDMFHNCSKKEDSFGTLEQRFWFGIGMKATMVKAWIYQQNSGYISQFLQDGGFKRNICKTGILIGNRNQNKCQMPWIHHPDSGYMILVVIYHPPRPGRMTIDSTLKNEKIKIIWKINLPSRSYNHIFTPNKITAITKWGI